MTQTNDYIPNGGIKEFNEAVAEHWTYYITTCQDRELFYRDYPFFKQEDMPKERVHDLYRVGNLPDITLMRQMGFPFNTDFTAYRLEFAEFIRKEEPCKQN